MRRALWSLLALSTACSGQKSDSGAAASGEAGGSAAGTPAAGAASGPTGDASVSGTIHFAGTPPANPTIDMAEEPECAKKYATAAVDSQYVVSNGALGNVFVYVKSGLPDGASYPAPEAAKEIDQQGCEYRPRVFGIQTGQKLLIKNNDPLLHNIKAVPKQNRGFNISQPSAGMKTTRTFNTAEVMVPLECNVHGWMKGYVGVLPHPFYATSTADGKFEIKGLPPGTYTIEAWHEKLGVQSTSVTVGAGESKTADFTFGTKA